MFKTYIVMGIVFVLLGLVMLFSPGVFAVVLVVCIGIAALVNGVLNIVTVSRLIDDKRFKTAVIIRAVLSIVVGILAIIFPVASTKIALVTIAYIIAIELIISALIEIYEIWQLRKANIPFGIYITEIVISIVLAILLFLVPKNIGILIIRIAGVLVVLGGIGSIAWAFKVKKEIDNISQNF